MGIDELKVNYFLLKWFAILQFIQAYLLDMEAEYSHVHTEQCQGYSPALCLRF